ncbi:MAG: hypothetical protein K2Y05_11270, partial [Hyphomicrobiaceae bacterium]|nr:hypothetical protein [Hyphomicrobiaceae bacterium]
APKPAAPAAPAPAAPAAAAPAAPAAPKPAAPVASAPAAPAAAAPVAPAASKPDAPVAAAAASAAAAAAAAAALAKPAEVKAAAPVPVADVKQPATPAATSSADDYTRIRAIDPDLQRRLNALGFMTFSDLAKMSVADVGRVSQTLGLLGRIEQENWIEQAQILSSGGDTYYSRRRQRGEIPPAAGNWALPDAGGVNAAADTSAIKEPQTPVVLASAGGAAAAAAAAAMATAGAAAATAAANASVEPSKPAKLADAIKSRGAEPEKRSDLTGLRSVRSEALRPDLTATEGLRSGQPRPATQIDDLKRVRGVGVLIEKKLNSLGVTTYEQIANWTSADIDRVSQILDFKGRIERENWVEQARILASGGHTEFSRRVDRGEA